MDAHLHAGGAIFNAGHHHAAHDAWEDYWLDLDDGPDERLLHGLIQYTAAIHHGHNRNWEGVRGLADSAVTYLDPVPDTHRDVDLPPIREYLQILRDDPEHIERASPPPITVDGESPTLSTLDVEAAFVAAPILADALDYDETVIDAAVEYARSDLETGDGTSTFLTLVLAFVGDAEHRPTIYDRLERHVDRRQTREDDVSDLF